MRVDLRSTSTTELERLERSLRVCLDQSVEAEQRAADHRASAQRKTHSVTCEVVVIGDRPAGELDPNARLLQVVRAVDAHLGNVAQVQRASTDANIPLSLGRQAIAIGGGGSGGGARIEAVGENAEILKLKGPQTEVIDLGGRFIMPGFNDAHVHLSEGGSQRLNVNLIGVKSLDEFRERIRAKVEAAAPGDWILGGGWDENLWPVKTVPTRWDVDEVSGDHPIFLDRVDGHIAVANTRALQLASITIASRDPKGGKIDRDSNSQPNGILRETARAAVVNAIPEPTHDKRRQAMEAALADAAQWGLTSLQDNSKSWEDFKILEEIE